MSTRFQDGLGRVISRDPNILELLEKNYRSSNFHVFAQAGIEIEALQKELADVKEALSKAKATTVLKLKK